MTTPAGEDKFQGRGRRALSAEDVAWDKSGQAAVVKTMEEVVKTMEELAAQAGE